MTAEWRDVPGFEGIYQVSNQGQVRSLDRIVYDRRRPNGFVRKGVLLSPALQKFGHFRIRLQHRGRKKAYGVHQLVLMAFVGPCPPGLQCCHNDGNPANNRVENLRWDTPLSNSRDAVKHGSAWYLHLTECPQGHPYDGVNTYLTPKGRRDCRACRREAGRRRTERERLKRAVKAS